MGQKVHMGLRAAATAAVVYAILFGLRAAPTFGIYSASAVVPAHFAAAGHGELFSVAPNTIDLKDVVTGSTLSASVLKIQDHHPGLPLNVSVSGQIASVMTVALAPDGQSVEADVNANLPVPPGQEEQLTGDVIISIGNDFDSITIPATITIQGPDPCQGSGSDATSSCQSGTSTGSTTGGTTSGGN